MAEFFEMMIGVAEVDFIEALQARTEVIGWAYDDDYTDPLHLDVETTEGSFIVCIDEGIVGDFVELGVDYAEDDDYLYSED